MQGMVSVTNYAKTTLHWSPNLGRSSFSPSSSSTDFYHVTCASWRINDQYYPAFITKHSTLLPVMMTENSSWSSCESLTLIGLSWWRKIIINTYSTLSRQTSSALSCNDNGALSNVILSTWQSSHQCYSRQDYYLVVMMFLPCHNGRAIIIDIFSWL